MSQSGLPKIAGCFSRNIRRDQVKDTGMALVLIFLLIGYFGQSQKSMGAAVILLIINMAVPALFKPLAVVWFGLSHLLGAITSRIILSILFLALVIPMSIIMKILKVDLLQGNQWKRGTGSVFKNRDQRYQAEDMEKPY